MSNADAARTVFGTIFHFLLWPLFFLGGFFSEWWSTRNWRWFFVSMPALVVGGAVAVGVVRAQWSSDAGLAASYATRAQKAFKAEDYQRAEMMYRKAIKYRPQDASLKFAQAFVLDKMDRTEDAFVLMQSVAPIGEAGPGKRYADAHLWIARSLLVGHVKIDGDPLRLAVAHLKQIVAVSPDHIEAHRLLADLAISERNGDAAIEHISHIVDEYPETRIIYARLLDGANRKADAKTEAARAFDYYTQHIPARLSSKENPPKAADWLNWASSAMILDRFNDAIRILKDATRLCEEKKIIRQGLAGVLVRWTQRLDELEDPNIRQQLELLGEAIKIAPDNPAVLERVALLVGRDEGADAIAEELLHDSLVSGTAPAMVHFLLGTRAASTNADPKVAQSYLEQALKLNPNTPVVLNNLAWVLATRKEPDLDRALKLADQAVKLQPYQPNFRDTRGQIHVQMGNWSDGIADLEEALRKLKDKPPIHGALATAYEKIGNAELAALHRKKVEELKAAAAAESPGNVKAPDNGGGKNEAPTGK